MQKLNLVLTISFLYAVLLGCSVEAIEFNCIFHTANFSEIGLRYECEAMVIHSGSTSLERVTGVHRPEMTNDDVESLYIRNQNLPFVPEKIDDFFGNLELLWIHFSSLTSISAEDLRPFPRLLWLMLMGNQIISLDGNLFTHTPNLQSVSFNWNQIQHIGHDLFTNLNNLVRSAFNGNVCIDQGASNREEVIWLGSQLSILCPPLDTTATTTTTTTTTSTTAAEIPIECPCDEKIEKVSDSNRALEIQADEQNKKIEQLNGDIEQLQWSNDQMRQENAAIQKRLLEVEIKLQEMVFIARSNGNKI